MVNLKCFLVKNDVIYQMKNQLCVSFAQKEQVNPSQLQQ